MTPRCNACGGEHAEIAHHDAHEAAAVASEELRRWLAGGDEGCLWRWRAWRITARILAKRGEHSTGPPTPARKRGVT